MGMTLLWGALSHGTFTQNGSCLALTFFVIYLRKLSFPFYKCIIIIWYHYHIGYTLPTDHLIQDEIPTWVCCIGFTATSNCFHTILNINEARKLGWNSISIQNFNFEWNWHSNAANSSWNFILNQIICRESVGPIVIYCHSHNQHPLSLMKIFSKTHHTIYFKSMFYTWIMQDKC